ncbi:toll/interleukin-1 receptor domain-containing protein [Hyalangium sp.]|uniref:toll/interleukin-1 receptor domain-containing protein n=1 Tax=Hyalangium sp. TaxID=2028555 RepID=UPI002D23EE92|nr:TIR domain-containing protein [Hyalangium sp.]HYH98767.1 TIR domain-containing protein [Hyalangium sp.]
MNSPATTAPSEPQRHYTAFISYRTRVEPDRSVAVWLQNFLEAYKLPRGVSSLQGRSDRRLGKIFRDTSDLPATPDLPQEIRRALDASEFLIVVSSRQARQSQWMDAEVQHFVDAGATDRILLLLVDAEPAESFPPQLEGRPLAADVRAPRPWLSRWKLRTEVLRLIAAMLRVTYDDLRRRERLRQLRDGVLATVATAIILTVIGSQVATRLAAQEEAERQQRATRAAQLGLLAQYANAAGKPGQAALLATEALRQTLPGDPSPQAARQALRDVLAHVSGHPFPLPPTAELDTPHITITPDGSRVLIATTAGEAVLREWTLREGKASLVRALPWKDGAVDQLAAAPSGGWWIAARDPEGGSLQLWRLPAEGDTLVPAPAPGGPIGAFSRDASRYVAVGSDSDRADDVVTITDLGAEVPSSSRIVLVPKEEEGCFDRRATAVAFSDDASLVAIGYRGACVCVVRLGSKSNESRCWSTGHLHSGLDDLLDAPIYLLRFSPDNEVLVTASGDTSPFTLSRAQAGLVFRVRVGARLDERLHLWSLGKAKVPAPVALEHDGVVSAIAFSPDGMWLATGSTNGMVRAWLRSSRSEGTSSEKPPVSRVRLPGHTQRVAGLQFLAPSTLVSWSEDHTVRRWQLLADGAAEQTVFHGHEAAISSAAMAQGRWLVTIDRNQGLRRWDLHAAGPGVGHPFVSRPEGCSIDLPSTRQELSRDGRWLITENCEDWRIWSLSRERTGELQPRELSTVTGRTCSLEVDPASRWLVRDSEQGLSVFRLQENGSLGAEMPLGTEGCNGMKVSPDGRWLLGHRDEHTVTIWELSKDAPRTVQLSAKPGTVFVGSSEFSPDGRWLVTQHSTDQAYLWQMTADEALQQRELRVCHLAGDIFSPDGRWLLLQQRATGQDACEPVLYDLSQPNAAARRLTGPGGSLSRPVFSPDGRWLAAKESHDGQGAGGTWLWRLDPSHSLMSGQHLEGAISLGGAQPFDPRAQWLMTWGNSHPLLWHLSDAGGGVRAVPLTGQVPPDSELSDAWLATWSPDGRWVAIANETDRRVAIWTLDAEAGLAVLRTSLGLEAGTIALSSSADGRFLALLAADGRVRLWDTSEPDGPAALMNAGIQDAPEGLTFVPGHPWLMTWGRAIRFWPLRIEDLASAVSRAAGRNFTLEEWNQFFPGREYKVTFQEWPRASRAQ